MKLFAPLKVMVISQNFGMNPQNYIKFGDYGHNGIDLRCIEGTDLFSPIDGEITEVGWQPTGYGLFYRIKNDFFECILAHLKENYLAKGSKVIKGQLIGKTGNTGNSTGPHLHFGVRIAGMSNPQISNYSDPIWYLNREDLDIARLQKELDNCRQNGDTQIVQIEKLQNDLEQIGRSLAQAEIDREVLRKERDQTFLNVDNSLRLPINNTSSVELSPDSRTSGVGNNDSSNDSSRINNTPLTEPQIPFEIFVHDFIEWLKKILGR